MKNKLIVIGWMSRRYCYLNIDVQESIRRFSEAEDITPTPDMINVYEFDDHFMAYDAWSEYGLTYEL